MPDNDYRQPPRNRIDVDAVIRRARRRRVPGQVGVALVTAVAAVGVVGGGIFGLTHFPETSSGSSTSAGIDSTHSSAAASGPSVPGTLPPSCGSASPTTATGVDDLATTVSARQIEGTAHTMKAAVILKNEGTEEFRGDDLEIRVILVSQGIVVWHTGPTNLLGADVSVDLLPGASRRFDLTLEPAHCRAGDDPEGILRIHLPALPAGRYRVFGEVQLHVAGSSGFATIAGPSTPVTLH